MRSIQEAKAMLSRRLGKLDEEFCLVSFNASTLLICERRVCYHLHSAVRMPWIFSSKDATRMLCEAVHQRWVLWGYACRMSQCSEAMRCFASFGKCLWRGRGIRYAYILCAGDGRSWGPSSSAACPDDG